MSVIASPCRDVCSLDQSGKYCIGCGRSLDEIARWTLASEAERQSIVAALPERLERLKA
jgi:predicted Fe-S protein YdhL (DUF1289 family)